MTSSRFMKGACPAVTRRTWPILLVALVLLCSGCARREHLPLLREMAPLPPPPICRVAVLPLQNNSDFLQGAGLVKKILMAELQKSGNYLIAQEADINKTFQQLRIMPGLKPSLGQMQFVADRIDAQILVTGVIIEMREDSGPNRTVDPKIILEINLRDGRNGEVLWTSYHRRYGSDYTKAMHFGAINSVAGLAQQMIDEIISNWFRKGLSQCSVLP